MKGKRSPGYRTKKKGAKKKKRGRQHSVPDRNVVILYWVKRKRRGWRTFDVTPRGEKAQRPGFHTDWNSFHLQRESPPRGGKKKRIGDVRLDAKKKKKRRRKWKTLDSKAGRRMIPKGGDNL